MIISCVRLLTNISNLKCIELFPNYNLITMSFFSIIYTNPLAISIIQTYVEISFYEHDYEHRNREIIDKYEGN